MNRKPPRTLDDILFEKRNREYGSYRWRKQYTRRLAISFLLSLAVVLTLTFAYLWYVNSAGSATVYLYSSYGPRLKSAETTLLSPEELQAYLNAPASSDEQRNPPEKPQDDAALDFEVVENPTRDTFTPPAETTASVPDQNMGLGSENDSTVFGGFLLGTGEGGGAGSDLDRFPVFPGGLDGVRRYIERNVMYPTQAIKQKIHGVVLISFDINKLGLVDNIKVERGVNPLIDEEAIKAIRNMPAWKPGMRHGRPVIVKFIIPVNFMPMS